MTGEEAIIEQGTDSYFFLGDNDDTFALNTLIPHASKSKHRLMPPQLIGLHEKAAGKPKEPRSTCHIIDEDDTIVLDNRNRTVTVRHDPAITFLVINVNAGIRNYQNFSTSFYTIIHDHQKEAEDHLTLDYDELQSN